MSDRPAWEGSASKRTQVALIARIGAPLVAALGRTWRYTSEGADAFDRCLAAGQRPILALWHGRILPATPFWRDRGIVAITSENFDGEWIARIMQRFGYAAARGSTSRGGVRALVQLKRLVGQGHSTAFTVDGPRGPARRAQPGALWLAKATGQPILPFHIEAASAWRVRSWDRALVPGRSRASPWPLGRRFSWPRTLTMPPSNSAGRISKRNSRGWNSAPPRCFTSARRLSPRDQM